MVISLISCLIVRTTATLLTLTCCQLSHLLTGVLLYFVFRDRATIRSQLLLHPPLFTATALSNFVHSSRFIELRSLPLLQLRSQLQLHPTSFTASAVFTFVHSSGTVSFANSFSVIQFCSQLQFCPISPTAPAGPADDICILYLVVRNIAKILFPRVMEEQRVPGDDREKRKCEDYTSLYSLDTGHGGMNTSRSLSDHTGRSRHVSHIYDVQ